MSPAQYLPHSHLLYLGAGSSGAPQAERQLASIVEEIQSRRCPPMGRFGKGSSYNIKARASPVRPLQKRGPLS